MNPLSPHAPTTLGHIDSADRQIALPRGPLVDEKSVRLDQFNKQWDSSRIAVRAYLSALLINQNDIEDCVQEVALIAWKKGPIEHGKSAFLGHCLTSARYIGMAARRKYAKTRIHFLPQDVAQSLADEIVHQELSEPAPSARVDALRSCLSRLDKSQRELLHLRYEESGTARLGEFAKHRGKSLDALYKQLERLRKALKDCVNKRVASGHELS